MPYTRAWDETSPPGTALAATLDTIIQNFKTDTRERVGGIFGLNLAEFTADPIVPKSLTLSVGYNGPVVGNVTGNVTGNLTGSVLTAAQPNITSLGTLSSTLGITAVNAIAMSGQLTGAQYVSMISTGANFVFGISNSVGGGLVAAGAGNYSSVITTGNATSLHLGTNGIIRQTIDSAGLATFTGGIAGTINTAAQPNITSLGSLTGLVINQAGGNALQFSGAGVSVQYMRMTNTGADFLIGIEQAAGASNFAGSSAYASVLGTIGARSLQFATNNTVRQTIDSAGNTVFTGTVTAANFVGPTSIDANNLTGNTLAANVVNSSLTSLGTIANLTFTLGTLTSKFTWGLNGYIVTNVTGGFRVNNSGDTRNNLIMTDAGNATFFGSVTGTSFIGNVTGTILTAAQANITSLGTLTSLSVGSGTNPILLNRLSDFPVYGAISFNGDLSSTGMVGLFGRLNGADALELAVPTGNFIGFTVNGAAIARFATGGQLLVGTTSLTGTAAGGIHAAGDSRFDALLSIVATISTPLTVSGSHAAGTVVTIDNTAGSSRGSVVGYNKSGVLSGYTGIEGVWLGSTSGNMAIIADVGFGINFFTNGNTTARMSINSAGAVNFTGAITGVTSLTSTTFTGNLSGTILTAAQANITSLGTLTGLTINGNFTLSAATTKFLVGATSVVFKDSTDAVTLLTIDAGANLITANQNFRFNGVIQDSGGLQVLNNRRTGWTAPTGTAQRGTFATDTVTLINLARAVKAFIDDGMSLGFIGT